ncbi:hypothetical protein [Kineosporia babensis]|uniref:Uncharacterized protein n=1 Tax=Kineosporia babensis TaxID=499548 RepID=A0A9X1NCS4_9ACTN|nr:hypothetical protein [Kineosporia babensis]MCD5310881.1 hypothetical protein [Kineosporia babensis]
MTPDETLSALAARAKSKQRHDQKSGEDADAMRELVIAGLKQGIGPTELVRASGWSPTYVRRIAREAGIPAAAKGVQP